MRRRLLASLLGILVATGGTTGSAAGEPLPAAREPDERQARVEASIERAIDFLLDRQLLDGSWMGWAGAHPGGITPLVVYALLRAGVPADHPAILRALEHLRSRPPERTYGTCCLLMALAATGGREHRVWMNEIRDRLDAWRPASGLYSYPGQHEDLSNTLFVALALDLAADRGVAVSPAAWRSLLEAAMSCLGAPERGVDDEGRRFVRRGFAYRPGSDASGSMTAAGITILEIARRRLERALPSSSRRAVEQAQDEALRWLADSYTLARNPPNRSWHFFHLWGYERVGSLLRIERIGSHDWYQEGAEFLLRQQKAAGCWYADVGPETYAPGTEQMAELRTCIALLFLGRATSAVTSNRASVEVYATPEREGRLRLRAAGDTPLSIWIEGAPSTVTRVDYFARPRGEPDTRLAIGSSEAADEGFPIRHEFPRSGAWEIWCEATTEEGAAPSDVLPVTIQKVLDVRLLGYASDPVRNLLTDAEREIAASSEIAKDRSGAEAFDDLQATYWESLADDADPWVSIRLRRPVSGNRVLVSPARTRGRGSGLARPRDLEITLNGRHVSTLTMPAERESKGVFDLPRPVPIHSIRVRVVRAEGGGIGEDPVALGEIELQRRAD
jgi:hypothetical protein